MSQALSPQELSSEQIADIHLATREDAWSRAPIALRWGRSHAFQAEMAIKYCRGSARQSERVFGWKQTAVALGLAERRTGITCVGAQSAHSGRKPWEEKYPSAAEALRQLAEAHVQQRSTFNSTIGYTSGGATEAIAQLKVLEFPAITREHLNASLLALNTANC